MATKPKPEAANSDPGSTVPPARKVNKTSPAVTSVALADIVIGMSRLLDRLANYSPIQDGGLGLTEWAALVALTAAGGPTRSWRVNWG